MCLKIIFPLLILEQNFVPNNKKKISFLSKVSHSPLKNWEMNRKARQKILRKVNYIHYAFIITTVLVF